jgi:hypothetical protein
MESNEVHNFLDNFFRYVLTDICNCVEKECTILNMQKQLPKLYEKYFNILSVPKKTSHCNQISIEKNVSHSAFQQFTKIEVVDIILSDMKKLKLLSQHKGKYYLLNSYKRFSWKNIQHLNNNDDAKYLIEYTKIYKSICIFFGGNEFILYMKCIFWFLRKIVVDSIVSNVINNADTIAISVGSTKIDSDYDVTLYGKYVDIYKVIHRFNNKFQMIFNETSDIIFDTNVYGASFIKLNSKSDGKRMCGDKEFEYIPLSSDNEKIAQHVWAFVKLLIRLEDILKHNDILYDLLKSSINVSSAYSSLLSAAEEFTNKYDPSPDYYDKIVLLLKDKDNSDENISFNNYISFVNYNGSETYFTRGAFLDIVVNQQMCGKSLDKILLSKHDYFDSFIENVADLMYHYHKDKYTIRAQTALTRIMEIEKNTTNKKLYKTAQEMLEQIKKLQIDCKSSKGILKCSNFVIMHTCMKIVDIVTKVFIESIPKDILDFGISSFRKFAFDSNLPSARSLENTVYSSLSFNSIELLQ